jgi:putative ABC transport system permease protein
MSTPLSPSRLLPRDIVGVGTIGLRTRKLRAVLSSLGIAIGIAAIVAVLGVSRSSQDNLIRQLDSLGTNLLTAQAGSGIGLGRSVLPDTVELQVSNIAPVQSVSSIASVSQSVLRSRYANPDITGGLTTMAARPNLLNTLGGSLASGEFLTDATQNYPVAVLGAVAAQRLDIGSANDGVQVYIGGHYFLVVGILNSLPLEPDIDRAALIGYPAAQNLFDEANNASRLYVRTDPSQVDAVRAVLPAQANPEHPENVETSRPSDALAARAAAQSTFTSLFLGLGAVALLVGGVGIANVMVISVLERRSEIGLRRALGATKRHIRLQFLTEALFLAVLGGVSGVVLGALVTAGYAMSQSLPVVVPASAILYGVGSALGIGVIAGVYPAIRAARLSPTEALRTT